MRRPLGCLTFSALVAAVLVLLAIVGAAVVTGNGIFSPGGLSAEAHGGPVGGVSSHADLEARCDSCHAPVWSGERMADRCLTCHTVVQQEIDSRGGLHGRLPVTATTGCRDCHTDHRGAAAALTLADPRVFPHEQTGYALTAHQQGGANGGIGCRDCHPGSPVSFSGPTCAACHELLDPPYMTQHERTFGTTCLACHDGVDSYGAAFDHPTYPLTGGHAGAQCGACHQRATTLAVLRATSTECVDCHASKDIHEGRLGTACAECHSPATWADATIDHDQTRFRLVGLHVGAVCESCHVERKWTGIATTCIGCHAEDDPHDGQFTGDCAACHAATGWSDVTFDHAQTGFALTGGHAEPACADCHANGRYVGTPTTCIGCHAGDDPHDGAFGKDCAACHSTKAWQPASFDHDLSAFPLTGAHRSATCRACHVGGLFRNTPTACASCHDRPTSHGSNFSSKCASCHSTKAWKPAKFDHDRSAFALTGAHRSASCRSCHVGGLFKNLSTACASCHDRPKSHGSNFSNKCASCHSTKAWRPATYNGPHRFPMRHGGAGGVCAKCHPSSWTSYSCARCHSNSSMTREHDEVSGFSLTTCARCHPTGKGDD